MKLHIHNPCSENWEDMQDSKEGKFCEVCSRCVIDFTDKTNQEIKDIITQTKGKVCGKISSAPFSKIAAGIILITNFTFVRAQFDVSNKSTLQTIPNTTKVSGRLVSEETQQIIAECRGYLY